MAKRITMTERRRRAVHRLRRPVTRTIERVRRRTRIRTRCRGRRQLTGLVEHCRQLAVPRLSAVDVPRRAITRLVVAVLALSATGEGELNRLSRQIERDTQRVVAQNG